MAAVLYFCVLAVFSALVSGQDKCASVQLSARQDCGDVSTTATSCVAKGCCWNVTTVANRPNCFYNSDGNPQCNVDLNSRRDCGDVSTTPDGCIAKGCCWQVSTESGHPNCFYKSNSPGTDPTQGPTPTGNKKIWIHMMPWFETKATNGGKWGIHWTMNTKNPDNRVNGKPDIATYYHPLIGPYASGDTRVIDWQLGLMKLCGVTGVLIDWPGTSGKLDYGTNLKNAEAIIAGCDRHGLQFAIVYEDHNLELANIPDHIGQGKADMQYIQQHYMSKSNYARIDGAPLLLDFGPQTLHSSQWDQIFEPLNPKPTFLILADKDISDGGKSCKGGFAWIWPDYLGGLQNNIYKKNFAVKMGVSYPGFNSFYKEGGWGDIPWKINVSPSTFQATLDLAFTWSDDVQVATWNDYGEGTMIEPTDEFQYQYLEILQKKMGVSYTVKDLENLTKIYKGN